MVTILEVRYALGNIDKDLLPDETINGAIIDAETDFEYLSDKNVPTQLIQKAVKYKAAYLAYAGYLAKMERGIDVAPTPQMRSTLDLLEKEVDKCLLEIQREYAAPIGEVPAGLTETVEEDM